MGKVKKEKTSTDETQEIGEVSIKEEDTFEEKLRNVNAIALPMASKKLSKKCYKLIKKGNLVLIITESPNDISSSF